MFKPTDKPKRYLAAAAFAAVLITVPCLGALNTSAHPPSMEKPAPEHFEDSSGPITYYYFPHSQYPQIECSNIVWN